MVICVIFVLVCHCHYCWPCFDAVGRASSCKNFCFKTTGDGHISIK